MRTSEEVLERWKELEDMTFFQLATQVLKLEEMVEAKMVTESTLRAELRAAQPERGW